jgi:thioredoxin reductase (NADPH)
MGKMKKDLIIIGGGPAGLTAGIYASRARLDVLLIEAGLIGGQLADVELVENYPGFSHGISGLELAQQMREQAASFGLETYSDRVTRVEPSERDNKVHTDKEIFQAVAIVISSGSNPKKLGIPGEDEFLGKGVSYCAACDGYFFREKKIAVVGGGNSAIEEALFLAKLASEVIIIHRRDQLRASKILQERALAHPRIEFLWNTVIEEIVGEGMMKAARLYNLKEEKRSVLEIDGMFVYAGFEPNTGYLGGTVPLDDTGHILVDGEMQTPVPGIFAAGDIRHNSPRQIVTACGDGATAALAAERFIGKD